MTEATAIKMRSSEKIIRSESTTAPPAHAFSAVSVSVSVSSAVLILVILEPSTVKNSGGNIKTGYEQTRFLLTVHFSSESMWSTRGTDEQSYNGSRLIILNKWNSSLYSWRKILFFQKINPHSILLGFIYSFFYWFHCFNFFYSFVKSIIINNNIYVCPSQRSLPTPQF